MRLRSVCVGVACGCCVMGIVAILWTLALQVVASEFQAINKSNGRPKRNISEHWEHGSSGTKYGWKQSFDINALLGFIQTMSNFTKLIRLDHVVTPENVSDGSLEETGTSVVNDRSISEITRNIDIDKNMNIGRLSEEQRKIGSNDRISETRHDATNSHHKHRSKKDTAKSRFRTLNRASQGETEYINLITPNPDIEITIEVVGDEEDHGQWETIEEGEPVNGEASTGGQAGNHGSSDSSEDGWLEVMRRTEIKQDDDSQRITTHWGQWSSCSASCGGGKKERSRYCGVNCIATERQDCNRMSCPDTDSQTRYPLELNTSAESTMVLSDAIRVLDPNDFRTDSCSAWMSCRNEKLVAHLSRLSDLPGCPCVQPTHLDRNDAIFDEDKGMLYRWAVKSVDEDWLDIYKSSASVCIQSLLSPTSTSLAAQQCCYDRSGSLITRGPGAGTPNLISTEISPELNYKIDVMPWIICKGDWTKYNIIRPPNNALSCPVNPDDEDYRRYWLAAKEF